MPAPARTASNDGGELAGAVADEEPEGGGAVVEVHQQVAGLLGGPGSGRMAGRAEDVHVAAADFEGEEHVDPFQGDRAVDVEEVHGQHGRGLRAQEPSPGRVGGPQRCRWYPPPLEDPADRGCADAVAELEQFALDALVAPGLVLAGHPFDQRDDRWVEGWATGAVRVGPLLGHQATVPPQDRGRGDQAMPAQHRGQASDERGEQGSVGPVQAGLRVGSAEYGDLVAQDEELDVLGRRCAAEQRQPARVAG